MTQSTNRDGEDSKTATLECTNIENDALPSKEDNLDTKPVWQIKTTIYFNTPGDFSPSDNEDETTQNQNMSSVPEIARDLLSIGDKPIYMTTQWYLTPN
jgi:hypothetical protein